MENLIPILLPHSLDEMERMPVLKCLHSILVMICSFNSVEVSTTKKKKKKKKRINQACLQNVYLQAGSRHSFIF
jgi:hypothetical protein